MRNLPRHRRFRQRLLALPLVVCALLTAGCSSGFFYNRLDTFAGWYLESLVSLNDGQRTEVRAWLQRTLAWHRSSELTRYASFLDDISTSIAQPGTRESYDAMRVRFESLISDLVKKTAPEASELLTRLSPEQVDELLESLADKTRESTAENAEAVAKNQWKPEQTKSMSRQMKRWTGSISKRQTDIIAKHVADLEPTYLDWAESQKSWRGALRDALTGVEPPKVLALLEDPDRQWTSDYSRKVERNRERYQTMLLELDGTLSPQQRAHLREELNKLSQQLTRLARG